ncbi:MFS transporter, partial [Streptomyces sp. NPDC054946]
MPARSVPATRRGAFVAVAVALFCVQLDFFALNLAVPGIAVELGVTVSAAQWTLSAYMLAIGCFFVVGGRVGDVFGRRGSLLAGIAVFAAGSVGCALAPGLGPLVAARVVQGVGAAFVFPVSVSVITNTFPDGTRAKALGAVFGVANIGTALGPFVGGGFTEGPGWRWIFWLMVPLSVLSLLTALVYVPDSRDASASRELDLPGCALIVCALAAVTLAVERGDAWGWTSAPTLACFASAGVAGGLFLVRERLARHPLVDLRLFRNVPYVMVTATGSLSNMGYGVTVFLATLYLQGVRGLSPLVAGTVFLAPALMVAVSGPLGARLARYMRPTAVMALAGAVAGTGMYALSLVEVWWLYVPVFAWCGLGLGLGWTFAGVATQEVVAPARAGEASGVLLTFLVTLGAIALAGTAAAISATPPQRPLQDTYDAILRLGGVVLLATAVVVTAVRHRPVRLGVPPLPVRAGDDTTARGPSTPITRRTTDGRASASASASAARRPWPVACGWVPGVRTRRARPWTDGGGDGPRRRVPASHPRTPAPPYPGTPVLRHPRTQAPPYSGTPASPYSGTPVLRHPGIPASRHPRTPAPPYSGTPASPYPGTPAPRR